MTATDIINASFLIDGITYPGQTVSTEAMAAAQQTLNNMLSEWNAQGLAVYSVVKFLQALTNGVADYTIGTGAAINTPRPEKIQSWRVFDASGAANGASRGREHFRAPGRRRRPDRGPHRDAELRRGLPDRRHLPVPDPQRGHAGTLDLGATGRHHGLYPDHQRPARYLKTITYCLAVDLAPQSDARSIPR